MKNPIRVRAGYLAHITRHRAEIAWARKIIRYRQRECNRLRKLVKKVQPHATHVQ